MNAKPKVLLVDNAKMMHGVVRARLSADGMEVHSAFTGEEGLSLAREVRPDLILLDVGMPPPDGFEVCRLLKDDPTLFHVPVIFLTGANSREETIRGLRAGAADYILKPFDAAELQARVRAGLRNKQMLDQLATQASVDGLTGLWNRGYLDQRLREELAYVRRHGRPMSCVMVDVDHFKAANDTYGHAFGDLVLKGVGGILQALSRTEDIACRYGGEEFAVLARETDGPAAMALAERMRAAIESHPFNHFGAIVRLTCSLGVAASSDGAGGILDRAEQAMCASKRDGRNRATLFAEAVIP
jgi:diguanylate cyclase (GGDEF)-like protein